MRIILLGPAGAGKGTQARLIADRIRVPHISMGDLLRCSVERGSDAGRRIAEFINRGELAPDEDVLELLKGRLLEPDVARGFISDGYPRTVCQAQQLDTLLATLNRGTIEAVIDLEVDEAELINRIAGRRICSGCGQSFHLRTRPPVQPGRCDFCGSRLVHRADDTPEAIGRRLQIYRQATQPLIDFYRERHVLRAINAREGVERTFELVCQALGIEA